jgi:hypothetical protein
LQLGREEAGAGLASPDGMGRARIHGAFTVIALALCTYGAVIGASADAARPPVLDRFLADDNSVTTYRALRRFEALNDHREPTTWMEAWTEADPSGFRYQIIGESGSGYIRSKVFKAALEAEQRIWGSGEAERGAITPDNYVFQDRGAEPSGLARVELKPRRKDRLLVDGSMFLRPDDGDLVRMQGSLAKPPNFMVRRVDIVRRYERVGGVRMPVSLEAVASVLIAGKSRFAMTYQYETVNGQHVGSPHPSE